MSLRYDIINEIDEMASNFTVAQTSALADAIIALVRAHMTSDEAVERAQLEHYSTLMEEALLSGTIRVPDNKAFRAAILAALEGDQ